ncbi:hypothetical protein psal_cds_970 [Pandoravirus salinus]|uniref:Uncharacterized protein n=1 Tax=Pandoravirus salinus TaxID=1349410 RepID=S4VWU5_9VIRU|nr:hypothetical protein psal_cds_970 [Pandoravirus salinus]AGO85129.2 hypothetical protein psal_cds_970 [Pandoravirus salinus]
MARDGIAALPTELWSAILHHLHPSWHPVAAHVCVLWRALVPADRRRLGVIAAYALLASSRSPGSCDNVVAWSLGVSRAPRALNRLGLFPININQQDKLTVADALAIDDALVAAVHLVGTVPLSDILALPLFCPPIDKEDVARLDASTAWAPIHLCSARMIQAAARCGLVEFLGALCRRVSPVLPNAWTAAVFDSYAAMARLRDLDAFAALRSAGCRFDVKALDAILDDVGMHDADRDAWIDAATRPMCSRCLDWKNVDTFVVGPHGSERFRCFCCGLVWRQPVPPK